MTHQCGLAERQFLGIEGGGTRTVALLADGKGRLLQRLEAGPANLQLVTDKELTAHFRTLAKAFARPDALGIGLAGGWGEVDWRRIRAAAADVWPGVPCYATNDLETALVAATGTQAREQKRGGARRQGQAQVLVVSGTGSAFFGRSGDGRQAKVGGWGHILGDKGSGYDIGLLALQSVVAGFDRNQVWPPLGQRLLRALLLNEPNELIPWAHAATKAEIAELAGEVFAAWKQGDRMATEVLRSAGQRLAQDAAACARKLAKRGAAVEFVLTGSILLKQPKFAAQVARQLRRLWSRARVTPLQRESVWGAVELAKQVFESREPGVAAGKAALAPAQPAETNPRDGLRTPLVRSAKPSPTEGRNPRSMRLDHMAVGAAVKLMLSEDATIPRALLGKRREIEQVVRALVRAFQQQGRLFYVGAGTSGRLGVLDASECPPTFGLSPDLVQGIIAGGQPALWKSVEGAEDDVEAGGRAMVFRGVTRRDVVIGIAASGTTPFVWGALREAKQRGATTVLVCFNPYVTIPRELQPSIVIAADLGPEVLTGSTRLKAGTATKLLLNLFTTLAMVRLGKVMSNLMVDMNPANVKLRDRAVRIVQALTGVERAAALQALEHSGWVVQPAVRRLRRR
jgi:N-acetylmuramic acid 6-phosphate etherase